MPSPKVVGPGRHVGDYLLINIDGGIALGSAFCWKTGSDARGIFGRAESMHFCTQSFLVAA